MLISGAVVAWSALSDAAANSHPKSAAAATAPANSASTKAGASPGAIPAKVSLKLRAMVTAGLAKDVEIREPIGRADIEAHRRGDGFRLEPQTAQYGGDQAERGNELAEPLAEAVARRAR